MTLFDAYRTCLSFCYVLFCAVHHMCRALATRAGLPCACEIAQKVTAPPAPLVLYGPKQTLGYAIHDLLPSFGVTTRVLQQTSDCMPEWQPATMLDVGAGPGTGIWSVLLAFDALVGLVMVMLTVSPCVVFMWLVHCSIDGSSGLHVKPLKTM